jgi:hypothetical protein
MATVIEIPSHDLPDWMRQARRGLDWGVVLIFAFSLMIAMPFLTQPNLPHTNASENYVYRTADYAAALQEGRLYPRWSANAFGGYGAPIQHYYPPAPGYLSASIHVLFTDDPVLAVRIVYAISLSMAGSMVYVFVTRRTDGAAGVLAGMLYIYSPYIGITAPHILGDLPGVMTFALIPMLLWSTDRLLIRNRPLDVMLIALTTSALYLTSFRAAIAATLLAVVLVVWHRQTVNRKIPWLLILASYGLGVGIASFYWIPALLEQDVIHWRSALIPSTYSLTLLDLLAPLRQIDINAMVHLPQFTLGIIGLGFAIAGAISAIWFRGTASFQRLFLRIGVILTVITLILFSDEIWLLGAIALCAAIGGSTVMHWREYLPRQWRRLFLPSLLILIWILSSPVWLPPVVSEPFGSADEQAQAQHEQQGYGIAVLPPDSLIPSTIPDNLAPNRFLLDGYQSGNINKIASGQFTANAQAGLLDHATHSDRYQLRANTPIVFNILTAYFPGWRATVSDRVVPLTRNNETGLMDADIPALSSGELAIMLGSTNIRTAAWIISWDMLFIALVITWSRFRYSRNTFDDVALLSYKEARLLVVVLVACASITLLFNQPQFPLSLRIRPGHALQNSTFIQSRTDSGLSLLAFRLDNNQYRSGDLVDLTLYWQAQRFLPENYQVILSFVNNRDGRIGMHSALHHPGNYPTRRWKTGLYVTDIYRLSLPPNSTPGNYQMNIEVQDCNPDCASGNAVTFFDMNGQVLGTNLTLPTLVTVSG